MRKHIGLVSASMLCALVTGALVVPGASATGQEQPGINRTTLQATARTLNFYGKNDHMWSWVPFFRFSLTSPRSSGDQHYVEYTIPSAKTPVQCDCVLNSNGNGLECGGRSIPEDKSSTYTGPVNFSIKVRNELQGTDATLFTGRMKVAKWSRMDCEFPMVKGWDTKGENQADMFKMAENPGEYELKLLWNNKLARSIKFTVGPNGKLDNGIASANDLGTGRVVVPVTIIGEQDGQWDRTAWKTEAFYGNPLTGFTPAQ